MMAIVIVVAIQSGVIVWLYGKYWIHNQFIKETAEIVNHHSSLLIDMAIQKALQEENYELAHELKKRKDNLCN